MLKLLCRNHTPHYEERNKKNESKAEQNRSITS